MSIVTPFGHRLWGWRQLGQQASRLYLYAAQQGQHFHQLHRRAGQPAFVQSSGYLVEVVAHPGQLAHQRRIGIVAGIADTDGTALGRRQIRLLIGIHRPPDPVRQTESRGASTFTPFGGGRLVDPDADGGYLLDLGHAASGCGVWGIEGA
ncbi:hypothetical protein LGKMAHEF_10027 (plasmid) [Aeromonas salmonicida]